MHKLHHLLHKRKIHHSSNYHTLKKFFSPLGFLKLFFYTKLVEQNLFNSAVPQQMNNSILPQSSRSATTKKIILSLVTLLLILVIGGLSWQRFATQRNKQNSPVNKITENLYSIKVGNELIYKEDITKMISLGLVASPSATQLELEKLAQGKIIYESIVLQGAETDGLITLDNTVFNSPNKDFNKRQQLVEQAQNTIEQQSEGIHGTVVALWFNHPLSPLTYNQSKQLASERMNFYYNQVKDHKLTITQAGQQLEKDPGVNKVLNPEYQHAVYFDFYPYYAPKITFVPNFDKIITSLPEGGLTPLYLAKDNEYTQNIKEEQKGVEALYLFAEVTKKVTSKQPAFADWYADKYSRYEIKYY